MSYKKALKKLESLPPGERQLAAGQYAWEVKKGKSHCGCAIGKLLTERQRLKLFKSDNNGAGAEELASDFLGIDVDFSILEQPFGVLDLTVREAARLQSENDSFGWVIGQSKTRNTYANRRARYKHIIAWLRQKITDEAGALKKRANPDPATVAEF